MLIPRSVLVNLYYSLVQSVVYQNIIIWGASPLTVIQPLNVKINNILRIILNVKRINYIPNMSTSIMYKELKILKLNDLYKFNILKFIHRTFHNDNGHLIDTYFSDLLINRENARRQRLRIPDVRLDIERQFTIFQACTIVRYLMKYHLIFLIQCLSIC